MNSSRDLFERRKERTRYELKKKAAGRPRLSVFRSEKHTYVQVIQLGVYRHETSSTSPKIPGTRLRRRHLPDEPHDPT